MRKSKKYHNLEDLISDSTSASKMDNNKKFKNKIFDKLFESEINAVYTKDIPAINHPDVLEGIGGIAWAMCSERFKQVPCNFFIENKKYTIDLLYFLKENGSVVYKKMGMAVEYSDIQYIIFYKECFYTITLYFTSNESDSIISGIGIWHSISTPVNLQEFEKFEIPDKNVPKIGLVKTGRYGPVVTWIEHNSNMKFDYDNYNADFPEFFEDLTQKITGETKTGLYLLHGEAGTGKSSAIRHLISKIDRDVVFIPPQMINSLSSPDFTDLVTGALKGCVLVIEDAEKALIKRETEDGFFNSELVSSVLNLTDGLYADLSQTAIIATYNCDRTMIDTALLRKGRMRSEYHFQKLSVDRSQKLMDSLNHEVEVKEPMTLADIFNYEKQFSNKKVEKKRAVGFGG